MSSLAITIDKRLGTTIVNLDGSADMSEVHTLRNQLETLSTEHQNNIIVDLSRLNFISSMGLGSLIQAHRQCRQEQGTLCLVNPQEAVARLLKTTQLDQLFSIYHSVDEAITGENK